MNKRQEEIMNCLGSGVQILEGGFVRYEDWLGRYCSIKVSNAALKNLTAAGLIHLSNGVYERVDRFSPPFQVVLKTVES
jgi:hypothetical protein